MANPDSERKLSENEQRPKLNGPTNLDLVLVLLAGGTVVFAIGAIGSAIVGQYPFTTVYAVLDVLFAYLLYHFRNRRRPVGQDFNL